MVRPTLIESLPDQKRELAANMCSRGEAWDLIAKYIGLEDSVTLRKSLQVLADDMTQPMTNSLYLVNLELAQAELLISVAVKLAEDGSVRHMTEYNKMSAHKLKIIRQLDELEELEKQRGRSWEPLFDTNSIEFRVFEAAMEIYLTRETSVDDGFEALTPADKARFLKVMAESG